MRVHEVAKELELTSKALLAVLLKVGVDAKSHASVLSDEDIKKVIKYLEDLEQPKVTDTIEDVVMPVQPAPFEDEKEKKDSKKEEITEEVEIKVVDINAESITVKDLCELINVPLKQVMTLILQKGMMLNLNQSIDLALASEIAQEYNIVLEQKSSDVSQKKQQRREEIFLSEIGEDERFLKDRPPVVTVMGHVDHGKTKLLDAIRKTNVVDGESGGITQHIGAYQVEISGKKITFIDTPGHEAFTEIRARGANVTDVVVLVVAADDGVMPQTKEAIHHAQSAKVPIIVAINKIDKPDANPDRVKQQLADYDLVPEEWGGKTIFVNISAKERIGIEEFLEMVLLVAETEELKANPNKKATGIILEANLSKNTGPVATVLVKSGTLRVGNPFVIGPVHGKIRALIDDAGNKIKEAGPSTPVMILGLSDVPGVGDVMQVVTSDKEAKKIATSRADELIDLKRQQKKTVSLDEFSRKINAGEMTTLNLIIKADAQGSLEAILGSINKIDVVDANIHVVHSGIGLITDSDVMLANASNGILIGFHVGIPVEIKNKAEDEGVVVKLYSIIYKMLEDIESTAKGMIKPVFQKELTGTAEVRQLFKFSKVGAIAGCFITEGKVVRGNDIEIYRGNTMIYDGSLDSLKRFKDDVKEVSSGFECGIVIDGFDNYIEGDLIKVFTLKEVKPK
ncbi:MAG: translation initiation factor IF-2 [Candidatus Margulisbacteria bacterium]|nr:translation initiation factor IF-2 [Candidatus Margulisiibacteriota bacterium]